MGRRIKKKKNVAGIVVLMIVGGVFLSIGYIVAFEFGKPILDRAAASENWPTVQGVVTSSKLVSKRDDDGDLLYRAEVTYEYTVNERTHTSRRVRVGQLNGSTNLKSFPQAVVDSYPKGSMVEVRYDPAGPDYAVLEPGDHWQSRLVWWIGLGLLTIGGLIETKQIINIVVAALRVPPPPQT